MSEKLDDKKTTMANGKEYYVSLSMDFYGDSVDMTQKLVALLRAERVEPFLMEELSRRRLNRGLLVELFKHFGVTKLWMNKRLSCNTIIMSLEDYRKLFFALHKDKENNSTKFDNDSMRRFACDLLLRFNELKRDVTGAFTEFNMAPIEAYEQPNLLLRKVSLNDASMGCLPLIRDCDAVKCKDLVPYTTCNPECNDDRLVLYLLEPGKMIYQKMFTDKLEINHCFSGLPKGTDLIGEPAAIAIVKALKVDRPCIAVIESEDKFGMHRFLVTDKDNNPLVFNANHVKGSNTVLSEDVKEMKDLKASEFPERYCIYNNGTFNTFEFIAGSVSIAKSK